MSILFRGGIRQGFGLLEALVAIFDNPLLATSAAVILLAVCGFVVAGIGMAVVWQLKQSLDWTTYPDWTLGKYVAIGALLSIASQVGDLTQSALKRDAGVKDSGNIFPGHGGVLDRCDGFLFAAPVFYYLLLF